MFALAVWILAGFLAAYLIHRFKNLSQEQGPSVNPTGAPATNLPEYIQARSGGHETEGDLHGWRAFAIALGGFQSRLILGAAYFSILALFGLTVGRFGNLLNTKRETRESSWGPREDRPSSLEDARRQF